MHNGQSARVGMRSRIAKRPSINAAATMSATTNPSQTPSPLKPNLNASNTPTGNPIAQ